jgi:lipopolysaccharide export system ATP-binding protein
VSLSIADFATAPYGAGHPAWDSPLKPSSPRTNGAPVDGAAPGETHDMAMFYEEAAPAPAEPARRPGLLARLRRRLSGSPAYEEPILGGSGILAVKGLQKSYRGRTVVHDAALSVRNGEAVGLLGPNGAGKTTIFYMITGLVSADRGMISLDGHDVTHLPMYRRSRLGIGYLPQEASIFRGLNVEDNIRGVLEVVEPSRKERERKLDALLEEFNITRLRKAPSIALSGGERRRCEIARALAGDPSFMLLDEPFAGIDPIAVGDIQNLVRHLTARGIGVLITDHNVRETLGLIDRAYIIHSGRVLTEGSPDEIVGNSEVRRLYLGEDFRL